MKSACEEECSSSKESALVHHWRIRILALSMQNKLGMSIDLRDIPNLSVATSNQVWHTLLYQGTAHRLVVM